jgi:cyclopropane fatty-acyl-phospholipid synthase-like methyltransferase
LSDNRSWREKVGGLWEQLGRLQFDYLVSNGLKPHHFLLDIGCGSLRGGIHFINYLEKGHYFGIDKDAEVLESARIEIAENNLQDKEPVLKLDENFDFISLNQKFEYVLAQSIFTHLPLDMIKKCIHNLDKVLMKESKFYATFFEDNRREDSDDPIVIRSVDGLTIQTHPNKDPYHYKFSEFQRLVEGTSLFVKYIGEWNHPRYQKIMVFSK